ncbi:MAG TPA: methionine--tRNA ligase subunit beta, partial [Flavobacterium sp.]
TNKYYDGVVPTPDDFNEIDDAVFSELKAYPAVISSSLERYRFREALGELMNVARLGNKYLADEEPWKVIKDNPERVKTQMYVALQISAALSILSEPFLPFTSKKLTKMLGLNSTSMAWSSVSVDSEIVPSGHKIGEAELLFSKIEDDEIQKQIDKLEATKSANLAENKVMEPQKGLIQFEDFAKMDIRVGTILEAEKMPKANKLLVLKVDTGIDIRTIVSGIAESFSPLEIIGKKVTVLVNLAPRNLRGIESQGMILMTANKQGKLVFVNPDADTENGETIN